MKYDDQIIDQVQSLNDIVEIISGVIPLKRAGKSFKALCPFHQEKTPSFHVNPERQIFHCFGCSVGGDVFTFLMKHENISFPEALRQLAERVHVILPEKVQQTETVSISGKLFEIYDAAFQYYRMNFQDAKMGEPARKYLEKRGFDLSSLGDFGIGYANADWRGLFEFLSKKGFTEEFLLRSGLIVKSGQGNCYDLLRGRLIFPIFNVQGKVVAFGGRILSNELPKYINSPESEIFRKRREFYGLHLAKRFIPQDQSRIFIVEGYLDQIRMVVSGFRNTVATLGTALTEEHVKILKRYVTEAVLVYDGDTAGESASLRGLEIFLNQGLSVKLLSIPGGMDPDDILLKQGAESFQSLVDNSQDVFDFKLAALSKKHNRNDALGLLKITSEFLETFSHIPNAVLLDRYINKLSVALGVQEDSIRRELAKLKKKEEDRETREEPLLVLSGDKDELTLLTFLLEEPSLVERALEVLGAEDFTDPGAREVYALIKKMHEQGEKIYLSSLMSRLSDERMKALLSKLSFFDLSDEQRIQGVEDCIRRVLQKNVKKNMMDLQLKIKQAEARGQEAEVVRYMKEFQSLMTRMR